ncbi:MAG: hypothetical protein QM811_11240 [Pirellulales bacterium]
MTESLFTLRRVVLSLIAAWCCAFAPFAQEPGLDDQLLDDGPPAKPVPVKPTPKHPVPNLPSNGNSKIPKAVAPPPADGPSPFGAVVGKMELVERRLTAGVDAQLRGLQDEIVVDLDKILEPGKSEGNTKKTTGASAPKSQNPQGNDSQDDAAKNQKQGKARVRRKPATRCRRPMAKGRGPVSTSRLRRPPVLAEESWGLLPAPRAGTNLGSRGRRNFAAIRTFVAKVLFATRRGTRRRIAPRTTVACLEIRWLAGPGSATICTTEPRVSRFLRPPMTHYESRRRFLRHALFARRRSPACRRSLGRINRSTPKGF